MRMKEDDWFDIIQTNLTSVYRLSKAVLRPMMKKADVSLLSVQLSAQWVTRGKPTTVRQKQV
ncbi:3-ketoacyl-ACP reductase [Actinobacillus equuli]|nr:3-ketoacyl-ACP reductase [Actinobacillus equuli]